MSKNAKLAATLAAVFVLAVLAWGILGRDSENPTAPAPRGQFATDRASEEPVLPVTFKQ